MFGASLRFRKHFYVFTKRDRDFKPVVWRRDPNEPIQHYRSCTVTYGTACAPFLSVRVLQQLASDNWKYPTAASIILNNVYVDDVMAGTESEELCRAKEQLHPLLESGGFMLRKWSSNS